METNIYAQSYVDGYKDLTDAQKVAFVKALNGRKVEFEISEYDETKKTEDQKITVSAKITVNVPSGTVIDGSEAYPELDGSVAVATITVKGEALIPSTAKYYFDTVGGAALDEGIYDGAAHTVVADEVPGWTVSYQVYNPTTRKYEDTSAVTITDVQKREAPLDVIAIWKKTGTTVEEKYSLSVNLHKAPGATVGFDIDASLYDNEFVYSGPGEEYNTADYIVVTPFTQSTKAADTAEGKAAIRAANAANQAAVAANEALIKEYFNDFYEVNAKTTKTNINPTLTIVEKELTDKEREEIAKKYESLQNNFLMIDVDDDETEYVLLNGDVVLDYEVEFTKAPAGAVVYSKGKTTKKGVLKKNKTITVKAVSNIGADVYYKLVNANSKITINKKTGKITVKKGLNKGTYTFKVKAYVPGHATGAEGWYEHQTIKVKIKK